MSDDLDDPSERLTRLFHEHSSRVLSYLPHRGAGDAGPDLLSETVTVAWRRIDDVPDPALAWLLVVARNEVLAAMAALSEQDREVLVLTGWDGVSTAGGAVVLGCAPGPFAVRLHRARRRLQRLLDVTEDSRGPVGSVPTSSPLAILTVSKESR